jgi:hypothetical protein|tara:strand:+ start:366 stop:971 length:606 start_codon:yes stop_codon:yes gene_type:complete
MFKVNPELSAKVVKINSSQIIEIKNFYEDPDGVREYALSSKKYTKEDNEDLLASAIGRRVCEDTFEPAYYMKDVFQDLCRHPDWDVQFDQGQHDYAWSGMRFMVNVTNNHEIIEDGRDMIAHVDAEYLKWACVIFLNKPEECEGGTGFYRYDSDTDKIVLEHLSAMEYNKAVLYPSNMIHGAIMEKNMFKDCDRLVQVMFM